MMIEHTLSHFQNEATLRLECFDGDLVRKDDANSFR